MNTCYRHESIVIDNPSISTEIRNGGKKRLGRSGKNQFGHAGSGEH